MLKESGQFEWNPGQFVLCRLQGVANSEFIIDQKDYDYCLNLQLDRNRAIAQTEGYKLEEMTREDFMGKIPVGSDWEPVALVHDGNWEYLQSILVGKYFAETAGEKIDLSQEAYEHLIQEYMKYWKSSEEDARRINTYDAFCMEQYQSCFYRTLRSYYKNCLLNLLQYKDSLSQIADLLCEKGTIRGKDLLNELSRRWHY